MLTLNNKCEKINDYLSSFFADTPKLHSDGERSDIGAVNCLARNTGSPLGSLVSSKQAGLIESKTSPKNEESFRSRLSTFEFGRWSCIELSPLVCSSYGWYWKEKDMLQCVTCKAFLCSSLPPFSEQDAYLKFLGILKKRIVTAHKDWCGWPNNPCNPGFLRPPLSISAHYLTKLKVNALKLCSFGADLPYFDHEVILDKLELKEQNLSIFYGMEDISQIQVTAALLLLCGWVIDSRQNLRCDICLRRINTCNFLSLEKEGDFLKLKKRYVEKREMFKMKEAKRREKELARKALEAKQREEYEAQEKAKALELQRQIETKNIQEAIDKISQLENENFENMESNQDEEIEEEEENSLLSEVTDEESDTLVDLRGKVSPSKECSRVATSDESSERPEVSSESEEEMEEGDKSLPPVEEESKITTSLENVRDSDSLPNQPADSDSFPNQPADSDSLPNQPADSANESSNDSTNESSNDSANESSNDSSPKSSSGSGIIHPRKRLRESESSSSLPGLLDEEDASRKSSKVRKLSETGDEGSNGGEANSSAPEEGMSEEPVCQDDSASVPSPVEGKAPSSSSQSVEGDEDAEFEEEEEDILFKRMEESLFEPLEQHRHWCGWVIDTNLLFLEEAEEQRRKPLLGFKILPPQLKEFSPDMSTSNLASSQKYAHNVEGLRAVRRILESWEVEKLDEVEEEEE